MGSQFPSQGSNPHHLQRKHGALTTGSPGKSLYHLFLILNMSFKFNYLQVALEKQERNTLFGDIQREYQEAKNMLLHWEG